MTGRNSFILGCLCTSHSAPRDTRPCAYRGAGRHRCSDTLETEKTRRSVSGISTASLSPSVFISLSHSLAVSFRVGRRVLSSPSPRPSQAQMPLLRQMSSVSLCFFLCPHCREDATYRPRRARDNTCIFLPDSRCKALPWLEECV